MLLAAVGEREHQTFGEVGDCRRGGREGGPSVVDALADAVGVDLLVEGVAGVEELIAVVCLLRVEADVPVDHLRGRWGGRREGWEGIDPEEAMDAKALLQP